MTGEPPADEAYSIRPLATPGEYRACLLLQERVWGEDFSERVPLAFLKVAQRLGGIAAGAFDSEEELAGFVFGLTGLEDDTPVHWSDMLAVRPADRDRGLGTLLKRYQRESLLERGVERAYWTFDPLESRNAYLNFGKLGIVVREYERDMYGADTGSPLHRAIGTDRFVALWRLGSPRVEARLAGREAPPGPEALAGAARVNPPDRSREPVRSPPPDLSVEDQPAAVTIPAEIQAVQEASTEVASEWRARTRTAFETYLSRGYEVRELVRDGDVSHYLLEPGD